MRNTEESRAFLAAIKEEGGSATTRQIRNRTDLTEGQLQHQFRKLEEHGFVAISRAFPTESGSQMKQASLTEKAQEKIGLGFLSGGQQPARTKVDVSELSERVSELEGELEELREYVSGTLFVMMRTNKRALESVGVSQDQYEDIRDEIRASLES